VAALQIHSPGEDDFNERVRAECSNRSFYLADLRGSIKLIVTPGNVQVAYVFHSPD
jgi:hypothetical protein